MNIQQLSANIDSKLAQLEQQIQQLNQQLQQGNSNQEQLDKDIAALMQVKGKLQKSRDLMWRAHALQRADDDQSQRRKRLLGISLCIISGLGLLAILAIVIWR